MDNWVGKSISDNPISQYYLSWNSFKNNVCNGFTKLQQNEEFVDMTLAADGHLVKAHKSVLALASPYIKSLLQSTPNQHPVVFLDNVSHEVLNYILTYIYTGEVSVEVDKIESFMRVAKNLRLCGLFGLPSLKVARKETEKIQTNLTQKIVKDNTISNSENLVVKRIADNTILLNSVPEPGLAHFEGQNAGVSMEQNFTSELNASLNNVDTHIPTDSVANEEMLNNRESGLYLTADGYQYKIEVQQGCNKGYVPNVAQDANNTPKRCYLDNDSFGHTTANNKTTKNEIVTSSLSSLETLDPKSFTPQYTVSNRGCLQLILNRYMYYCHHQSHGGRKRRWRCIDYKSKRCPAFIDSDCGILTARKYGHAHQFHDEKIRKKMKNFEVVTNLNMLLNKISPKKKTN